MYGLVTISDRHGKPMEVLAYSSGTRAAREGTDIASVALTLTTAQLDYWLAILRERTMMHEASVLQAEIDQRDPGGTRGTLWEQLGSFWPEE